MDNKQSISVDIISSSGIRNKLYKKSITSKEATQPLHCNS